MVGRQSRKLTNPEHRIPNPGLYVHLPFCASICNYCNFTRGLFDADLKRRYVDALLTEIREAPVRWPSFLERPEPDTLYFGGGTPSLLEPDEIARIIEACRLTFGLRSDEGLPTASAKATAVKKGPRHRL